MKTLLGARAGIVAAAILLVSCVSTRVDGRRVDPSRDPLGYESVLVFCDASDESIRETVERAVSAQIDRRGLAATPSLDVLVEPRGYSEDEVFSLLLDRGEDALIRVAVEDFSSEVAEYPGGAWMYWGPCGPGVAYEPPTTSSRSYLTLTVEVVDASSRRVVWRGDASSSTPGIDRLPRLAEAVGSRLVDVLRRDHVVTPRRR